VTRCCPRRALRSRPGRRSAAIDRIIACAALSTEMTDTALLSGTPGLIAPEVVRGDAVVDAQADQFQLRGDAVPRAHRQTTARGQYAVGVHDEALVSLTGNDTEQRVEVLKGRGMIPRDRTRRTSALALAARPGERSRARSRTMARAASCACPRENEPGCARALMKASSYDEHAVPPRFTVQRPANR
jgi:hypothetical protein